MGWDGMGHIQQGCAPHPAPPRGKRAAPPRPAKKQVLPRPARPVKIGKSCGAGWGKVDLNPNQQRLPSLFLP